MVIIADYFDKYGFNDGNRRLLERARERRAAIRARVNEVFARTIVEGTAPRGVTSAKMVECDVSTSHIKCRAMLQWKRWGRKYEWDNTLGMAGRGQRREATRQIQEWIDRVLEEVQKDEEDENEE
jgi:hypothetical protein